MGEVKLHGTWVSGFNSRVVWALKLKGVAYEYIEEDLFNKSPQLLQYNPVHKKIPVLVHAGKPICESMVIIEYIDEIWPHNPLFPSDPYDRALTRFWVKYAEDKGSAVVKIFSSRGEEQKKAIKEGLEMLKVAEEQCLGEKKFFGGDNINILDLAFGLYVHWLGIIEDVIEVKLLEAEKFPRLHSWINNFRDVPVIRDNLPNREKMLAFYKGRREYLLASSRDNKS